LPLIRLSVESMRELACSRALAACTIELPWLSKRLVTPEICCTRFSDTPFSMSARLDRPSMACSDWRVMLSLVRRTASMPVIIDSSR
jgi:hypothetical protein